MKADAVPLLNIFAQKRRLEVPLFQRQYVWNLEEQWEPLWEDVSRKFTEALIRYRDTGPELNVRRLLRRAGIRGYRINYGVAGKPDLTIVKRKIAMFIDGCFWHRCPVDFREPQTRKGFWIGKV